MKEDFVELVQYLDEKFRNIETKLDGKAEKSDLNQLVNSVDAYAHKADAYFQEMVMYSNQMKRHEKWFEQIAAKLGMKLEH